MEVDEPEAVAQVLAALSVAKSVPEVAGQVQAAEALVMSEPEAVQALFLLVDFAFEPDFDFELIFLTNLGPTETEKIRDNLYILVEKKN